MTVIILGIVIGGLAGWYVYYRHSCINGVRNVVLISIDTCRADRLSCYGYKRLTTPNIDAVARDGVLFQRALTPVPVTLPAHISMFTGMYPPTHGVRLNNGDQLAAANVTLAEILRESGYQTAGFIGAFPLDPIFGINQGFDLYDCHYTTKREKVHYNERQAEEVNRPALTWLEQHAKKPFFLFLHYFDPHQPYEPPLPYSSVFADDRYAGEIAYVDYCIGEIMRRLRALGVLDDTLVIITGDHGQSLGEHGELTHGYYIYQSTLRVPLVMRAPHCRKGHKVEGNVSLVDIAPTVLDLVGLRIVEGIQGVSLRRCLEGGPVPDSRRPIYCESLESATFECSMLQGIVEGLWKYIQAPRQELYDLAHDFDEQNNLFEKEPQIAQRLRGRLEEMLPTMKSASLQSGQSTVDIEALKRLQSLGYVGGGTTSATTDYDPKREDSKDFFPTYDRLQKVVNFRLANKNEQAKKELLEILTDRPRLISARKLLGEIALDEHRLGDAEEQYRLIMSILAASNDSTNQLSFATLNYEILDCHINFGRVLIQEGKMDQAAAEYEKALRIKPNLPMALNGLAAALLGSGRVDEAIAHCRKLVEAQPDYKEAQYFFGLALQKQGKDEEAAAHYQKALEVDPGFVDARINLGIAREKLGDTQEAINQYRLALKSNPQSIQTLTLLVAALAKQGLFDEAISTLQRLVRTEPQNVEVRAMLGNALRQGGRFQEAIRYYEEELRLRPDSADVHYNLGVTYAETGRCTEAIAQYTKALVLNAEMASALNNLAWIRATNADPQLLDGGEAVRLAENACKLTDRKDMSYLDTLAAAYAEVGRFKEAIATAEEAAALARSANQLAIADAIQSRIVVYREGQPYRESPRPAPQSAGGS